MNSEFYLWMLRVCRNASSWQFCFGEVAHLKKRISRSVSWSDFLTQALPKRIAWSPFFYFTLDVRMIGNIRIMNDDVKYVRDCQSRCPRYGSSADSALVGGLQSMNSNKARLDSPQYTILREGEAEILLHGNDVFYNKAQIVNRDISIAVIRAFVAKREEGNANSPAKKQMEPVEGSEEGFVGFRNEGLKVGFKSGEYMNGVPRGAAPSMKPLRVLEALAASGLRALRYAKEIDAIGSVVATDNDRVAFEACERNIRLNGQAAASKVEAKHADARVYMLTHEKDFDVVDLDPYGSPSVFLDSAVQTVADGGLLFCTATDMAVLCGNNGEVCYSKYGSYPLRGKYCHEMALRILLASIESHANRYKRHIVPLLSLSVDFYIRVFVRIFTSAKMIKATPSKLSHVYQCVGCDSYHLQSVGRICHKNNSTRYIPANGPTVGAECQECGKRFNFGGPIWAASLHDPSWVHQILSDATAIKNRYPAFDKLHSILTAVSEELSDVPLYLSLHSMSATLKCTPPSATLFRSAVANAGYRISGSHANPLGIKTDAPMTVLWDIMRCWVKTHPVKTQASETAGAIILSKEPKVEANFMKVSSALSKAQSEGVARFLPNPDFWGPKPRAGRRLPLRQSTADSSAGNAPISENYEGELKDDMKRQKDTESHIAGEKKDDVKRQKDTATLIGGQTKDDAKRQKHKESL